MYISQIEGKDLKTTILKIINKLLSFGRSAQLWIEAKRYRIKVYSSLQTIRHVQNTHCSVSRFGDGELNMILKGKSIGFQNSSPVLSDRLKKTLLTQRKDLLICLPHMLSFFAGENSRAKEFWISFLNNNRLSIYKLLSENQMKNYCFGDTQMTRPYIDYLDKNRAGIIYAELKKLWDLRDILIIEGSMTKMGVGNDLFDNARSIKRIICPAKNAFESYDRILKTAIELYKNELILIALGPTATVLADDLSRHGYWALDVGHLDVEYEWYIRGMREKSAIEGKYVNEVPTGERKYETENELDAKYLDQIIARI